LTTTILTATILTTTILTTTILTTAVLATTSRGCSGGDGPNPDSENQGGDQCDYERFAIHDPTPLCVP
jgi:hypothetical protein